MNMLSSDFISQAIECAKLTRLYAFASRSEHLIGASVITLEGEIFGGCNIESNISGLGICAERSAINHAITHGKYSFVALVLYDMKPIIPCGACLQYIKEFEFVGNHSLTIVSVGEEPKNEVIYTLKELLPNPYVSKNQAQKLSYMKERVE